MVTKGQMFNLQSSQTAHKTQQKKEPNLKYVEDLKRQFYKDTQMAREKMLNTANY